MNAMGLNDVAFHYNQNVSQLRADTVDNHIHLSKRL